MPDVVFHFVGDSKEFDLHDPQLDTVEGIKNVVQDMVNKKGEEE
jgi:hypothetical protein